MLKHSQYLSIFSLALALSFGLYWYTRPPTTRQLAETALKACERHNAGKLWSITPESEKETYGLTREKVQRLLDLVKLDPAPNRPGQYMVTERPSEGSCSVTKWFSTINNHVALFGMDSELHEGFKAELCQPITKLLGFYVILSGETLAKNDKHLQFVDGIRKVSKELARIGFKGMLQNDGRMLGWQEIEQYHLMLYQQNVIRQQQSANR